MKSTFISTSAISAATRQSLMKVQQQLADAQKEMISGRLADVGQTLGFKTGQTISLRQEHSRLNTIIETNSVVSSRLDASQKTLQSIVDDANAFVQQMLGARVGGANAEIAQDQAKGSLDSFINLMNTTFGGGYLFAGVNTDVKPLSAYFDTPTPANQQGVANAFFAQFGITQTDPTVSNITPTDMQTFLDTPFADLFNDPSWITDWSSASDQNVRNRVSTTDLIETSANANEDPFRMLAKAYTMVADLGTKDLQQGTLQVVIDQAVRDASTAIEGLGQIQSRLGVSQQRVSDSSERMKLQVDIMSTQVTSLEGVDPNEAATRVSSLMTQIESSYALTARIMNLSILNYL